MFFLSSLASIAYLYFFFFNSSFEVPGFTSFVQYSNYCILLGFVGKKYWGLGRFEGNLIGFLPFLKGARMRGLLVDLYFWMQNLMYFLQFLYIYLYLIRYLMCNLLCRLCPCTLLCLCYFYCLDRL